MLDTPAVNCAPRRIFPPPITMAICTPCCDALRICPEMAATSAILMTRSPACVKLSPESFSTTRRSDRPSAASDFGIAINLLGNNRAPRLRLSQLPVNVAKHLHAMLGRVLADGLLVVLDERLL